MTDLKKIVKRRSIEPVRAVRKRIIVALMPGDIIGFKVEHERKWYTAPLGKVFCQIAQWNADAEIAEKRRQKIIKRKLKQHGISG